MEIVITKKNKVFNKNTTIVICGDIPFDTSGCESVLAFVAIDVFHAWDKRVPYKCFGMTFLGDCRQNKSSDHQINIPINVTVTHTAIQQCCRRSFARHHRLDSGESP